MRSAKRTLEAVVFGLALSVGLYLGAALRDPFSSVRLALDDALDHVRNLTRRSR